MEKTKTGKNKKNNRLCRARGKLGSSWLLATTVSMVIIIIVIIILLEVIIAALLLVVFVVLVAVSSPVLKKATELHFLARKLVHVPSAFTIRLWKS